MSAKCDLPLHGLTVVIETRSDGQASAPKLYIGRFDYENEEFILLHDADVQELGPGFEKDAYLLRTAKFGVRQTVDRVTVRRAVVESVRRLTEVVGA